MVTEVREGTPAAAGRPPRRDRLDDASTARAIPTGGDVITAVDGVTITDGASLQSAIDAKRPGDTVSITYTRDGTSTTVQVSLGTRPS